MKYRVSAFTAFSFLFIFAASMSLAPQGIAQEKQKSSALSAEQKKEVQDIIGDYLRANPEIVMESIHILQERERRDKEQRVLNNLVAHRNLLLNDPTSPVVGNPKGDVTVVEFFDYNCGYCKRVFPAIEKLLAEDKKIRFVFKEFPILSPQSELAARAALAVWRQDKSKYMQIHTEFINLRGGFTESRIMRLVEKLGLDPTQLKKDMTSTSMNKVITANRLLARQLDISGTPGFIIGDEIVPGAVSLEKLKQLVATARKG